MSGLSPVESTTKRVACIDCGTNSVKLIVADIGPTASVRVFETSETTRIGEGMHTYGMRLREAPMRRTLDALDRLAGVAREQGAAEIAAVGTAALRDAVNRDEFLNRLREQSSLELEVISGQEEARLSFLAVRRDPRWLHLGRLFVIDIGGGSTEIIQGAAATDAVIARTSVNIGAVKLTEQYLKSDPPTTEQLSAANHAIEQAFDAVRIEPEADEIPHVVGVGGTFTNLGAMWLARAASPETLHGLTMMVDGLNAQCIQLAGQTLEQRKAVIGLDPARADIILGGILLLLHALARIGVDRVDVSTRGLRWGVLYDRFGANDGETRGTK